MCSSKFSASKLAYKRPVVCKKQPTTTSLYDPPIPLLQLQAHVSDRDWDPMAWRQDSQTFPLLKHPAQHAYSGQSSYLPNRYELTIAHVAATICWNVILDIYDPYRNPETFVFPNVAIEPTKPFDTGLLFAEAIPGIDYQMIRILE